MPLLSESVLAPDIPDDDVDTVDVDIDDEWERAETVVDGVLLYISDS